MADGRGRKTRGVPPRPPAIDRRKSVKLSGVRMAETIAKNTRRREKTMENEWIEKLAVQDLLARYAHAIDDLDPEAWAQCFTPDGVFQVGSRAMRGQAALREYGKIHVRKIRCRHMTGNFLYE